MEANSSRNVPFRKDGRSADGRIRTFPASEAAQELPLWAQAEAQAALA